MKTTIRLITLTLTLFTASAFAESAEELLEKIKAKYSSCESFRCEGENKTSSNEQGLEKPFRSEKRFTILFKRPDLLRVDWKEPNMSSFSPINCSLYTNNGKYYGISSFQRVPTEFQSMEMGMGAYAGISGGNTYFLPSLLCGMPGYFVDYSGEMLPDTKYEGVDCYVIGVTDKKTGKWHLTVNKATLAILRTQQNSTITAAESNAMLDEAKKIMADKNLPFTPPAATDLTLETNYDLPKRRVR